MLLLPRGWLGVMGGFIRLLCFGIGGDGERKGMEEGGKWMIAREMEGSGGEGE